MKASPYLTSYLVPLATAIELEVTPIDAQEAEMTPESPRLFEVVQAGAEDLNENLYKIKSHEGEPHEDETSSHVDKFHGDKESEEDIKPADCQRFREICQREKIRLTYLHRPPFELPKGCADRLSIMQSPDVVRRQ